MMARAMWIFLTVIFCTLVACPSQSPSTDDETSLPANRADRVCTAARGLTTLGIAACKEAALITQGDDTGDEQQLGVVDDIKSILSALGKGIKAIGSAVVRFVDSIQARFAGKDDVPPETATACNVTDEEDAEDCATGFEKCKDESDGTPAYDALCQLQLTDCTWVAAGTGTQCRNLDARKELDAGLSVPVESKAQCEARVEKLRTQCASQKSKCDVNCADHTRPELCRNICNTENGTCILDANFIELDECN